MNKKLPDIHEYSDWQAERISNLHKRIKELEARLDNPVLLSDWQKMEKRIKELEANQRTATHNELHVALTEANKHIKELQARLEQTVHAAGCTCPQPLLGFRPNVGPRCRLCNVVADPRPRAALEKQE